MTDDERLTTKIKPTRSCRVVGREWTVVRRVGTRRDPL